MAKQRVNITLEPDYDAEIENHTDITGVLLSPGEPQKCLGSGDVPGTTCCCDECDFYLRCFPEWDKKG